MKKLLLMIGVIASLVALGTTLAAQAAVDNRRNWGHSAVVTGGAFNQKELDARIKSDAKALFKKLDVNTNLSTAKNGILKPNGDIYVNGKKVATNAYSLGRDHRPGSAKVSAGGTTFYKHKASTAFPNDTPVFVFFNADGTFRSAMAKVCGNPIVAKPTPKPYFNCEDINATKISRTSFKFKTAYTAKNGAKHKSTTYIVRDSKNKIVQNSTSTSFKTSKAGKYTVEAVVSFTVNGKTVKDTSPRCKLPFTVAPEPIKTMKVCDLKTYKNITIDSKKYDSKKHSKNFDDCKKITVCELNSYKNITIRKTDFNKSKHSTNFDDCKKIKVCKLDTRSIVEIRKTDFDSKKHSTNLKDCVLVIEREILVCDLNNYKLISIGEKEFNESKHSKNFDDCKKITVCELETAKTVTIRKTDFDSKKHSTNFDDCKEIVVCELATDKVITIRKSQFDSKKHSMNLEDCQRIEVCELETGKIITIRKTEQDDKKHSTNLSDCEEMTVCELETKNVITIRKSEYDTEKHSTNLEDCKTVVCEVETKEIVKVDNNYDETKYTTDLTKCEETPVTPPETPETPKELPTTGPVETVASGLGIGALIAAASYYAASRRTLFAALLNR